MVGAGGFIGRRIAASIGSKAGDAMGFTRSESSARSVEGIPVTVLEPNDPGLEEAIRRFGPSVVFNLAATGVTSAASPDELEAGNAGVVSAIMDATVGTNVEVVVHAGTWSQYGPIVSDQPLSEDHPQQPATAYGLAKARAEAVGISRARNGDAHFLSLRLFNVYGPGEAPHRLIPAIASHLAKGSKVPLTEGHQVRDFVHVDDVVSAFGACLRTQVSESGAFNIATGTGTAVREIAQMVAGCMSAMGDRLDFGAIEARTGEPSVVIGDSARFQTQFGWKPQVPVTSGVCDTVEWATRGTTLS